MKRNDAEQIGEMIRKFFRQNALEAPLNEYRLIQAWKDVVGPAITKYTSNLYIKNQILYVHLTSSVRIITFHSAISFLSVTSPSSTAKTLYSLSIFFNILSK